MQRSAHTARAFLLVSAIAALACSRRDPLDQAPPARTAPWPAQAEPEPIASEQIVRYRLLPDSHITVDVPDRATPLHLGLRQVEGRLTVDRAALVRSRGSIRFYLAGIQPEEGPDALDTGTSAAVAREALGIGPNAHKPLSEELLWGRFEVTDIGDLSAPSVLPTHQLDAKLPSPRTAAGGAGTAHDSAPMLRTITAQIIGNLDLRMRRTVASVRVKAVFGFPDQRGAGTEPATLEVSSTRPLVVPLDAHGITPFEGRANSKGRARVAKVSFVLRAQEIAP